jgi:AcrR family transcriptional regulator
MKNSRIDVGSIRREQIVEAAAAIIAEQGLHELSLSAIERRAGMSRGQLTYYFPSKEAILLAVFDRMLRLMHERATAAGVSPCHVAGTPWDRLRHFLTFLVLDPPTVPEFRALQYTFLAEMGHRDDFRERLANLYEGWRNHLGKDLAGELDRRGRPGVSPRTLASFLQAVIHGLAVQRTADPDAYDRHEMLTLLLDLLGTYLGRPAEPPHPRAPSANGTAPRKRTRTRR